MKERPILFSDPMVSAILAGRKTQTRRPLKPQPKDGREVLGSRMPGWWWDRGDYSYDATKLDALVPCPIGAPGDRLYVRETFASFDLNGRKCTPRDATFVVLPDGTQVYRDGQRVTPLPEYARGAFDGIKWRPSIHMPRWASRLTLEITGIRVERVQAISEEDARAEGLACLSKDGGQTWKFGIPDRDGLPGNDDDGWHWQEWDVDPRKAFARLWEKVYGAGNLWVWVVSFTVLPDARESRASSSPGALSDRVAATPPPGSRPA